MNIERIAGLYERVAVLSGVSACFHRTFLIKRGRIAYLKTSHRRGTIYRYYP
jgi:hypothetical protein